MAKTRVWKYSNLGSPFKSYHKSVDLFKKNRSGKIEMFFNLLTYFRWLVKSPNITPLNFNIEREQYTTISRWFNILGHNRLDKQKFNVGDTHIVLSITLVHRSMSYQNSIVWKNMVKRSLNYVLCLSIRPWILHLQDNQLLINICPTRSS